MPQPPRFSSTTATLLHSVTAICSKVGDPWSFKSSKVLLEMKFHAKLSDVDLDKEYLAGDCMIMQGMKPKTQIMS
ncbi:hypothetical protein RIF29_15855 [Crotalaria pallida]